MVDVCFNEKIEHMIDTIGFISVMRNEGYTFKYKNGKEKYSLIYVENGELEYYFPSTNQCLRITKGAVLYIPKLLPYETMYLQDNTIIKILVFDIADCGIPKNLSLPIIKKNTAAASVFNSIAYFNMNNTLFLVSKAYEMLSLLQKDSSEIPLKYQKLLPAIREIKEKFFENKKVSYYADLCNMCESNFRILFKELTGKSFIDYRNYIRIFEAKKMIDSGETTVTEAAYLTGFNNMAFFYKIYNRYKNG
ncbi:MAG: helix-turn-helix transcriptional regulator [Clostridia bacterium]|nr:helix-turn-helix transcriptional regulator [Clostridia bacterium]